MSANSIDPTLLARTGGLTVRARRLLDGVLGGIHRSRRQGEAVEFAEHKEYAPGDDVRHIDWRVWARNDRYTVKKFEVDTHLRAWIVVDSSGSMAYAGREGTEGVSKLEVATTVAAVLSGLLLRQNDLCGLVLAGDGGPSGIRRQLPPRTSKTQQQTLWTLLEESKAEGTTSLATTLEALAPSVGNRALVFVLSDLFDFDHPDRSLDALARLQARGCDVAVLHVLHPDELTFPFEDPTQFTDLEGDVSVEAQPAAVRDAYLAEMERFLDQTRRRLQSAGVDYQRLVTDTPLDRFLTGFLAGRRGSGAGRAL